MNDINTRAMLVSLRLSAWSARKYDKRISDEVARGHHADRDAGRYNKHLLPGDAASYKELNRVIGQARTEHYAQTLAWSDEGWRLLPTANYMQYTELIRKLKSQWETALEAFLSEYPDLRELARVKLNGMYRDEDYPSLSDLRGRYGFDLAYNPLPASDDFRLTLPQEELDSIAQSTEARITEAVNLANRDAWNRLHDAIAHIAERLSTKDAIFRDSLIGNVGELCDALKRLNVTDDPELESMRARVESELAAADPNALRDSNRERERAARKAEELLAAMKGAYGDVGQG